MLKMEQRCLSLAVVLYHKIQSVCVFVSMFVRNRLPNHAYYGDEAFAGDLVGPGLGQRLKIILKQVLRIQGPRGDL